MITQRNVDGTGCFSDLVGDLQIGTARCRIAAWMVVRANDGRGSMLDRGPEHFPWMRQSVRRRTGGNLDQFLEPVLAV